MTEHANCQPEAWSAAARVARELREEVERLRAIIAAVRELHGPDDPEFLKTQGWAYCKCGDDIHPCDTTQALER